VACVLLPSALSVLAAPYLPGKPKLRHEVRSLADLTRVRLETHQHARDLTDLGLTGNAIAEQAEKRLAKGIARVAVVEDPDAPLLKIEVYGGIESNLPDALAFMISLKLIQTAHVARTDETLDIPTYTLTRAGMDKFDRGRRATERSLGTMLDTFMTDRTVATQEKRHRRK